MWQIMSGKNKVVNLYKSDIYIVNYSLSAWDSCSKNCGVYKKQKVTDIELTKVTTILKKPFSKFCS